MTGTIPLQPSRLPNRLIEWEPYKGACSNNFQSQPPLVPTQLKAYKINPDIPEKCRPDFLDFQQLNESLSKFQEVNNLQVIHFSFFSIFE
jgi:hypothetical protein